eukprot:1151298-Pelagomonas_calceolata.AAC.1
MNIEYSMIEVIRISFTVTSGPGDFLLLRGEWVWDGLILVSLLPRIFARSNVVIIFVASFIYASHGLFGTVGQLFQMLEGWEVKLKAVKFGDGFTENKVSLVLLQNGRGTICFVDGKGCELRLDGSDQAELIFQASPFIAYCPRVIVSVV